MSIGLILVVVLLVISLIGIFAAKDGRVTLISGYTFLACMIVIAGVLAGVRGF